MFQATSAQKMKLGLFLLAAGGLLAVILVLFAGLSLTSDVDRYFEQARGPNRPWTEAQMFQTRIRRNIRLAEAPSFGQSIFGYAPDSHGADDYTQLAHEVLCGTAAHARQAG